MSWDFSTEPEFQEKLDWMRKFVKEEVWPLEVIETDLAGFGRLIKPLQDEVKARGLWATHLPPEHGGQGYGQVKLGLMHEIEGSSSLFAPMVFGNQAPDSGNSEILALYGTEQQKQKWLRRLLDGEYRSAFSMTEPPPGAGADPTMLRTTARREGDEWVINGHKWFTSNAMVADFLIVMAVTEPENDNKYARASMIIVPKGAPGLNIARNIPNMVSEHEPFGFGHSEVFYDNCRVPIENLLGPEGQGFLIAQARLGPGRIHHCMRWLGVGRRAFDMLCEWSLQRETFGGPLARKQTVQNWIADSAAEMQAARLMTLHAAWKIDQDGPTAARKDISMIKFFGARVLHDVIDRAIQVHGALGFSSDLPLEMMYRAARAARIYDGPDEVHRVTVARQILRDYTPNEGPWPKDHIPTRRAAAERKFAAQLEAVTANL
jgi:acyl-CoA dehydrogenase